jgi:hypothetical protein
MRYTGPDRRIHKVYVTRNTEYHFRGTLCVGVRDRKTSRWRLHHPALEQHLTGSLYWDEGGSLRISDAPPGPGGRLCFGDVGLVTSLVQRVQRAPLELVSQYPIRQLAS